jgi:hypothetical protein
VNRVQSAIARWTGVDEQIREQSQDTEALLEAVESVASTNALLERQVDELLYIDLSAGPGDKHEIVTDDRRLRVLTRIRRLRHENPIAKQAVKLILRFTLGNGVTYVIPDEQLSENFGKFWDDPENQAVLTGHQTMVRRFDEVVTDGEDFIAMATAPAAPYVTLATVPLEEIKQILYHPRNNEVPVWYKRVWYEREYDANLNNGEGGWKQLPEKPKVFYYRDWRITDKRLIDIEEAGLVIPESKQMLDDVGKPVYMKHRFINPVRMKSGIRGLPELFASRDWVYGYKNFMEDRLAINAAAAAMAIHRKVKGGPAKVQALRNSLGGINVSPEAGSQDGLLAHRYTRPSAGSIITTTDAEDLKGIKVDTGAPSAALDANGILTAVGAGTGNPVHYFGSSNTALASTQSIEIAVMKGYEDWQSWVKTDLDETAEFVFRQILGENTEVSDDEQEISWELPPIEGKDIVKHITANAQFAQQIAPGNRPAQLVAIKNGLIALKVPNVEQVMREIEADQERVFAEKEALREQMLQNGAVPGGPPGANGNGKNGNGKQDGQKATDGTHVLARGPDDERAAKLKPPRETTTGPRTSRQ